MDKLVDKAIQCVTEIGQCLWVVVQEHSGYIIHHNGNVEELKERLKDLVVMVKDTEIRLGGKAWSNKETLWLERLVDMQEKVNQIEKRSKENRRWLFCPDLFWRYSVGREAKEKTDDIELHKKNWESEATTGNPPSVDASTSAGPAALVKDGTNPVEGQMTISSLMLALLNISSIKNLNLSDQNLGNGSIPALGGLTQLESLDLSKNYELSELPFKKGELVNLLELNLKHCKFRKGISLAALGGLEHLKYLCLSENYELRELPIEMAELVNLRYLELTRTRKLEIIPQGVISRLIHLKELYMWKSFSKWEVEDTSSNATLAEVASLENLSTLFLFIEDPHRFPQDRDQFKSAAKLQEFHFRMYQSSQKHKAYWGDWNGEDACFYGSSRVFGWMRNVLSHSKHLRIEDWNELQTLDDFGELQSLVTVEISNCDKLRQVFPYHLVQQMENLTDINLENCRGMEHVLGGLVPEGQQDDVQVKAKNVTARRLENMKSIWTTGLVVALPNLTILEISGCHALEESVLPFAQIKGGLPSLFKLTVDNCKAVKEIFSDMADQRLLLPKLEQLKLRTLPQLARICGGKKEGEGKTPQIQLPSIEVSYCPKLSAQVG